MAVGPVFIGGDDRQPEAEHGVATAWRLPLRLYGGVLPQHWMLPRLIVACSFVAAPTVRVARKAAQSDLQLIPFRSKPRCS